MKKTGFFTRCHCRGFLVAVASCVFITAGCADDPVDLDPKDGYQLRALPSDDGDCVENDRLQCDTPVEATQDPYFGEFEGNLCEVPASQKSKYQNGYYGYIDARCHKIRKLDQFHEIAQEIEASDIDYIVVEAEPGTPLEVTCTNSGPKGKLVPVLILRDEAGYDLVFSTTNDISTSLKFMAPSKKFYVTVQDAGNYDLEPTVQTCKDGETYRGGESYGYSLYISRLEKSPVESFGKVTIKKSATDFFDMSGTVHYYRAKVEDGQGLKVSVTPQGLLDTAKPVVSPIQRQEGKYVWTLIGSDLEKTYNAGSAKTEISPSLRDAEGFLWFAVSEYNGKSGYSYEVIVEPVDQPSN